MNKLLTAKFNKKDNFNTQYCDIENEIKHYTDYNPYIFKDMIVVCPCETKSSNFTKYFINNFFKFGLKILIVIIYNPNGRGSYAAITENNINNIVFKLLNGNGDFRSEEVQKIFKFSDFVITNPPFSLFREFVKVISSLNIKYSIIGNQNSIACKDIFKLIKENKLWMGYGFSGNIGFFINEEYEDYAKSAEHRDGMIRVNNVVWFTNIDYDNSEKLRTLNLKSLEENEFKGVKYYNYENYDAINVDVVKNIPNDYYGIMGVPLTFLHKYDKKQFEILGLGASGNCEFKHKRKMIILENGKPKIKLDKNGNEKIQYTTNAKGNLYRLFDETRDNFPNFQDVETGALYTCIYFRILIKMRNI